MFAKMMVAYIDMLCPRAKFRKSCEFQSTWVIFKNFAVYVGFSTNNFEAFLANFLDKIHDWNDVTKSLWHSNVFSFCSRKSYLWLKFWGPTHRTCCIEDYPATAWLGSTGVYLCEALVPISGEIRVAVAFEALSWVWLELESVVTCLLQVAYQIQDCFPMRFPWVRLILGNLVHSVHDVRASSLSDVVELANGGPVVEV